MVNAPKLPLPKIMGRDSNAAAATKEETKPKQNIFSKLLHKQPRVSKKSRYLFPADVASKEIIDEILQDKGVVSLEIEDLIADQNCRSLASNLSLVFCLGDRQWQSVTFLDSIAPEEFITWRGHKHAVMTTLAKLEHNPLGDAQVQFRVNIEFPPGTSIKLFMDTLRNVNKHNLVQSVEFYGALHNVQKNTIIGHLQENVDSDGALMNTIRLEVVCGLVESSTKFELVEMCLQKSRDMAAKATNTTENLTKKGQALMDGSSRKSNTSRTESETEPDSPIADASPINRRRLRHGNRRSALATGTRLHLLQYCLLVLTLPILLAVNGVPASYEDIDLCNDEQRNRHPHLCHMLDRVAEEPEILAEELWEFSRQVGFVFRKGFPPPLVAAAADDNNHYHTAERRSLFNDATQPVPVVTAHGMGDSCFNNGMQELTKFASHLLDGVYSVCIPTGETWHEDTTNGYFKSMQDNVEIFAAKVRADPQLANGFYGIGLSQGNNILRGYLSLYNDPPVKKLISINGVNAGTGLVPYCIHPNNNNQTFLWNEKFQSICDVLEEQASQHAYSDYVQKHSFQANYWRDPRPEKKLAYQTYSQLAQWNNEGLVVNETLKENWKKTDLFVWIKAEHDSMVWPAEGEHWGAPDPNDPFNKILPMKETEWYQKDLFGLRTADEAGKNAFESFSGDHLAFDDDQFASWVNKYLKA